MTWSPPPCSQKDSIWEGGQGYKRDVLEATLPDKIFIESLFRFISSLLGKIGFGKKTRGRTGSRLETMINNNYLFINFGINGKIGKHTYSNLR